MATFTLDSSRLAGSDLAYAETVIEDRGRMIQVEWNQGGANRDFESYGYAIRYAPAENMTMAGQVNAFDGSSVAYVETIIEERGRGIQIEWNQDGANQDMEVYGHAIRYVPTETAPLDQV